MILKLFLLINLNQHTLSVKVGSFHSKKYKMIDNLADRFLKLKTRFFTIKYESSAYFKLPSFAFVTTLNSFAKIDKKTKEKNL